LNHSEVRFELKLAIRYLRARRRSIARFTAYVAVAGITAGVGAMIVAQALAKGFEEQVKERILSNTAHVMLFPKDGTAIPNADTLVKTVQANPNVTRVDPTTYDNSLLIGNGTSAYAVLRTSEERFSSIAPSNEITALIGAKLADSTGLKPGDVAQIVVHDNGTTKTADARILNTFKTGLFDYDSTWIYVSPGDHARIFNRSRFHPTTLSISLKNIFAAPQTAVEIRNGLSEEFSVVDWQEANQPLFAALSLEKRVTFLIISLVIIVAALNITTSLSLLVNERRFDIAVLRTCGAKARSIVAIFVFQGLMLGVLGIIFGSVLGSLATVLINRFEIVRLDPQVYAMEQITLRSDIFEMIPLALAVLVLSVAATLYPAFKSTLIKPTESLQPRS
jgi:lipoprotein-releasing system permease protein